MVAMGGVGKPNGVAVGAGLLVRSLQNLHDIDPGFATSNLLLFEINPSLMGYNSAQTDHLYRDLQERLAVLREERQHALGTLLTRGHHR